MVKRPDKVITNVIIRVVPRIQESFVPLWMRLFLYFIGGVYGRKRIIRKKDELFGRTAALTASGQLEAETFALAYKKT